MEFRKGNDSKDLVYTVSKSQERVIVQPYFRILIQKEVYPSATSIAGILKNDEGVIGGGTENEVTTYARITIKKIKNYFKKPIDKTKILW